jgi:2-methylcitrate dehydratase PrpD
MAIARRMAHWAKALKYEDLPCKTVHGAKRRVIDSLATTLGAYHSHPGKIVREKAMPVSDPKAKATVWGTPHRTLPELAAFANGAMVRYLDYNHTYLSLEPAHPSDNFAAAVSIIGSEPEKLRPTSRETADHSMFYCCAAALVDGDVTLATFDEHRLNDPKLLDLIDRTKIVEDPKLNEGYPEGIPNDVTITCTDGTKLNKRVDFPRGHARNPMTDEEVVAKFHRMAQGVVTDKTAATILDLAWNLDELSDLTPLFSFEVTAS